MQARDLWAVSPALSQQFPFHFKGDWDNLQMILGGQVLWDTLDTLNSSCSGPSFIYTRIFSHPPTRSCLSITIFSGEGVCPNDFHVCFTERIRQCTI